MLGEFVKGLTQEGGPLRVRSILAFTVSGVYVHQAVIAESISPEDIKELTLLVLAFYFITRAAQGALARRSE